MTATEVASGSQTNIQNSSDICKDPWNSSKFEDGPSNLLYHLKWIQWNSCRVPIVMQSINGPCPLIAVMNVLLLREKVKLPSMLEQITADQLLTYLGECIMDCVPDNSEESEETILNLEQHIHDAMEILPKLNTGLYVNVKFTGITDFEYTPECIIFDLLRIPLYHGWLCDPSLTELKTAIGNQSYNQLVDNIISNKNSASQDDVAKVLLAEEFLERTASQLTVHGLEELKNNIKDNEIGILFRNNHFLTLFKRDSEIYTLVTDHGYLTEDNVIWETLDNIEGAGVFFDSEFRLSEVTPGQASEYKALDERQRQVEDDYFMALWLMGEETNGDAKAKQEGDLELAKRLQNEEDMIYRMSKKPASTEPRPSGSSSNTWSDSSADRPLSKLGTELWSYQVEKSPNSSWPELESQPAPIPTISAKIDSNTSPDKFCPPDSTNDTIPLPSSSNPSVPSGRNQKSEKNSKEFNCIVN